MQDDLLDFWFGRLDEPYAFDTAKNDLWFRNGRAYDTTITERYATSLVQARAGELDGWAQSPTGALALLLVLDQLPRHIHRGTPAAFETDAMAQRICTHAIDQGLDEPLHAIQRTFFYLPLEHAEDLNLQRRSVACYRQLADAAPDEWRDTYLGFLDYAQRHCDFIERFGRFPHRNAILGRVSTLEESEFLTRPGSSFL